MLGRSKTASPYRRGARTTAPATLQPSDIVNFAVSGPRAVLRTLAGLLINAVLNNKIY